MHYVLNMNKRLYSCKYFDDLQKTKVPIKHGSLLYTFIDVQKYLRQMIHILILEHLMNQEKLI